MQRTGERGRWGDGLQYWSPNWTVCRLTTRAEPRMKLINYQKSSVQWRAEREANGVGVSGVHWISKCRCESNEKWLRRKTMGGAVRVYNQDVSKELVQGTYKSLYTTLQAPPRARVWQRGKRMPQFTSNCQLLSDCNMFAAEKTTVETVYFIIYFSLPCDYTLRVLYSLGGELT